MIKHPQTGAALLVFMLLIVISASFMLMRDLKSMVNRVTGHEDSIHALEHAKTALMGWAINHPVNPGTLPMPDRRGDGNYDGDSDCSTNPIGDDLLIGKLPWRDDSTPCKDMNILSGLQLKVTDSAGERLWYAVSHNLVYETPEYPFISPALLNKPTRWITVRNRDGNIISDRVAFVILAPGFTLNNQDRSAAAPTIENYLDSVVVGGVPYSNADSDQDFIIYPDSDRTPDLGDSFNDKLLFVTIDELMDAVGKRVLNETANILTGYHNDVGNLPWLSPFADPKAMKPLITGVADSGSSGTTLVETSRNFAKARVNTGDIIYNLTDGSVGVINGFPVGSLTVSALELGGSNVFSIDDAYYIDVQSDIYTTDIPSYVAVVGSSGLLLEEDAARDLTDMGITPGDVLENVTNSSRRIIAEVAATRLTAKARTAADSGDYDPGDVYRIFTNMGKATSTTGLTLTDTTKDFTAMGVNPGDLVVNLTDDRSVGSIVTVNPTTLTVDALRYGTANSSFDSGDSYILPRFNPVVDTSHGHLAFHEPGKIFKTAFSIDWHTLVTIGPSNPVVTHTLYYEDSLQEYARTSNGTSGGITVAREDGFCTWSMPRIAQCRGSDRDVVFEGVTTAGFNTSILTDTNANTDFVTAGIKPGDIVQNYDDASNIAFGTADAGSTGTILVDAGMNFTAYDPQGLYNTIIQNTSMMGKVQGILEEVIDANTIRVKPSLTGASISFAGGDSYVIREPHKTLVTGVIDANRLSTERSSSSVAVDFDANEYYRIKPATQFLDGVVETSVASNIMTDSTYVFASLGILAGDVIENIDDGSIGDIDSITGSEITAVLRGGTTNIFTPGDRYRIHYGHVNIREYEFNARFSGQSVSHLTSKERLRDVCLGYSAVDCTGATVNTPLPVNIKPMVVIRDYDDSANLQAGVKLTMPMGGTQGNLRITDMEYHLHQADAEIPEWFIRNKWYQYVYVVGSKKEMPGGASDCNPGSNCLVLNVDASSKNDIRALVMLTGEGLPGQFRTDGAIDDYYELLENRDVDDIFQKGSVNTVAGVATPGSLGLTLEETGKDFVARGISPGYSIENVTDQSSGIVQSVTATQLTVSSLSGGAENDFDPGESYRIINNDLIRVAVSCPPPDNAKLCWFE